MIKLVVAQASKLVGVSSLNSLGRELFVYRQFELQDDNRQRNASSRRLTDCRTPFQIHHLSTILISSEHLYKRCCMFNI